MFSSPLTLQASKIFTYLIAFRKDNPSLTVSTKRPRNLAVTELLCADFASESAIGLVEDVLRAYFNFGLQVFADEEEKEAGGSNNHF